jgi:hypothetical protein
LLTIFFVFVGASYYRRCSEAIHQPTLLPSSATVIVRAQVRSEAEAAATGR